MTLRAVNNDVVIQLDGTVTGDAAVTVPNGAINDSEMLNEPGLAQNRSGSCLSLTLTTMVDLTTVSITIPTDGYIYLNGMGMVEFSGVTGLNRIDVQIDETSGGGSINGYFARIGLAGYSSTSFSSFSYAVSRTYYKTAGTYTFRVEAERLSTGGSASICYPTLTAIFMPTSYGSVATVASNSENGGSKNGVINAVNANNNSVEITDLRDLEIRAREAREQALQADLDLINAKAVLSGK